MSTLAFILIFVAVTSFSILTQSAAAQTTLIDPNEMLFSELSEVYEPYLAPPGHTVPLGIASEIPVERFRQSFYQGAELRGGYLHDLGSRAGGLDVTFEEARVGFGVPLGSMDNVLAISPFFRAEHFNGPTAIDVPGSVYSTGVMLFNRKKWSETFSSTVILTPAIRSDFTTSDDAFRIFGLALVNWQKRSDLAFSFGVVYLDRADLPMLPAFGLTWTPTPYWNFDIGMPRPRISRRLWKQGGQAEAWAYFGATIGGNTWAVTRDSGETDELTIGDLRLLAGYEVIRQGNRGLFVEAGYAFNRSIEYEKQGIEIDLSDALFVQAGWQF